jgi:hypothetical protein
MRPLISVAVIAAMVSLACATARTATAPQPPAVRTHGQWQSSPPSGQAADATRRNAPVGGTLASHDLAVTVLGTSTDSSTSRARVVRLRLRAGDASEERTARDGEAFNWHGYHIAVVAAYATGELGGGLVALGSGTIPSPACAPPSRGASVTATGGTCPITT